jgi:hypothetical protein
VATQVINPVGLSELILDEVRQHGVRPRNELLVTMCPVMVIAVPRSKKLSSSC